MSENYLRIDPTGDVSWISIDRIPYDWAPGYEGISLDQIYAAIGCNCFEQVRTTIRNVVMLVDDCGKIQTPPKPHNELASWLYAGWLYCLDDIVGSVILCELQPTEPYGELDLFPLSSKSLQFLSNLGIDIPAQEVFPNE